MSERIIREDIQIVENIAPEIQEQIKESEITKKDAIKEKIENNLMGNDSVWGFFFLNPLS